MTTTPGAAVDGGEWGLMTTVRPARAGDLPFLAPIEDAADSLFVERFGAVDWPPASSGEERAAEPGILLVAAEVVRRGGSEVTLMTFSDVPWNGPFYTRHGYAVLDPLPEHLRPFREAEERFDLARHGRRVAMVTVLTT